MENREELLNKLKELKEIFFESEEVEREIEDVRVKDNYERKCEMPKEPEVIEKVEEPTIKYISKKEMLDEVKFFIKLPIIFLIVTLVQVAIYFIAKSGIDGSGSLSDQFQVNFTNFAFAMIFVFLGIAFFFGILVNLCKYLKVIIDYKKEDKMELAQYKMHRREYDEYLEKKKKYDEEMKEYERKVQEHKEEEDRIDELLEKERESIQNKIREEKYDPIIERLREESEGILYPEFNLRNLSRVIDIIESGRADDVKEALNVLDEIKYRESQQEFERYKFKKEEQARIRQEREEEKRYEDEKREADRRRQEDLRREAQQRNEDLAREEKRLREERSRNHRDAVSQCSNCRNIHHCRNYGKFANCPNYRPR